MRNGRRLRASLLQGALPPLLFLFGACQTPPPPAAESPAAANPPKTAPAESKAPEAKEKPAPGGPAAAAPNPPGEELPEIEIVDKLLTFDEERRRLTLEYIREHYDPAATEISIDPGVIIIHWTGGSSAKGTLSAFASNKIEPGRESTKKAGDLNVSSHFLIDRDGTIYRLVPEDLMARHCIGMNRTAIGVENVGGIEGYPLTEAQLASNAALVRYLKAKLPKLTHLIGHLEYRAFEGHPYFEERDPKYRNAKPDPGKEFMEKLRASVKDLGLEGPPAKKK
jgi:N-acetylmuramoyl-L-alanine amidase